MLNYSLVKVFTSFLTIGAISKLVGKPTTNPIVHPTRNLCRKPVVQPVIIAVMVKVMVESKANVMKMALSTVEYFLFINMVNLSGRII